MTGLIEQAVRNVLVGETTTVPAVQDDFQVHDMGSKHKLVICQRGFVYAGDVEFVGEYVLIRNAVNVRKWGTSRGLGQLAESGLTPETKADQCGDIRIHKLGVVALMDCKETIHATP